MLKNSILKISKMVLIAFIILIVFTIFFVYSYINGMKYHPNYSLADEILVQDEDYFFCKCCVYEKLIIYTKKPPRNIKRCRL